MRAKALICLGIPVLQHYRGYVCPKRQFSINLDTQ